VIGKEGMAKRRGWGVPHDKIKKREMRYGQEKKGVSGRR